MYEKMNDYLVRLEAQIAAEQAKLKALGRVKSGNFVSAKDRSHTKWYITHDGKREYIPKEKIELAKLLAEKKFLEEKIKALAQEKKAVNSYLKNHAEYQKVETRFLSKSSPYRELLPDKYSDLSKEIQEWMNEPFPSNPYHLENKKFKSPSGNILRSKSELLIDMELYKSGIPYRYESELLLKDGSVVYPDFTIMKADGSLSYYEHFGMMDSSEYFDKFMSKILQYERNGIVPNRNLFMTFETLECPLSIEDIQWVISKF